MCAGGSVRKSYYWHTCMLTNWFSFILNSFIRFLRNVYEIRTILFLSLVGNVIGPFVLIISNIFYVQLLYGHERYFRLGATVTYGLLNWVTADSSVQVQDIQLQTVLLTTWQPVDSSWFYWSPPVLVHQDIHILHMEFKKWGGVNKSTNARRYSIVLTNVSVKFSGLLNHQH